MVDPTHENTLLDELVDAKLSLTHVELEAYKLCHLVIHMGDDKAAIEAQAYKLENLLDTTVRDAV